MYYNLLKNIAKDNSEAVAFYIEADVVGPELFDFMSREDDRFVRVGYSEFYEIIKRIVKSMGKNYNLRGEYMGVLAENNFETIAILFAIWGSGYIPILLNSKMTEYEIAEIIGVTGSIKVLNQDDIRLLIQSSMKMREGFEGEKVEERGPDELAVILSTSGTRGKVKLVELSFDNYYQSFNNSKKLLDYSPKDKWLLSLPIFHSGGLSIILRALFSRASVIITSSKNVVDNGSEIYENVMPTKLSLVQTQLKRMGDNDFPGVSKGAVVLLGGGPIEPELMSQAIIKGLKVIKVYGSTETASMITGLTGDDFRGREKSAGKPFENVEIEILNKNREVISNGEAGEIAVKSKSIFKGYLNNQSETEKSFFKGYYVTGDIGYLDQEGFLFVLGREDDVIISGGEKILPCEIEKVLNQFQGVTESAVFGIESSEWGEEVCAAMVTTQVISISELKKFLGELLASYKIPKKYFIVSELPKTSLGKIKRERLKNIAKLD